MTIFLRLRVSLLATLALAACHHAPAVAPTPTPTPRPTPDTTRTVTAPPRATPALAHAIVPRPTTFTRGAAADSFTVTPRTGVYVDASASVDVAAVGTYAAQLIASAVGATTRRLGAGESAPDSSIALVIDPARTALGAEGYDLEVTATRVRIVATQPAGLFYGVQTLRQLLPPAVEHLSAYRRRMRAPAVHVVDTPRFPWRGMMLDVARHFLPPDDVKHFVDLLALYKLNRLHLHLADDQGWRIEIKSWPNLATVGGQGAIGGVRGGFYTQAEYADIVAYAQSRFITVVPEIDMPGHSTAALVSYPGLRCNHAAPTAFAAIGGPPNTLCVDRDSVYAFIRDVAREITAAAPTPYFHIGGDEVDSLTKAQYRSFIERVDGIVRGYGVRVVGWSEIAPANISPTTIVQHWQNDSSAVHVARGGQVIMSPSRRGAYLDMKYDSATTLGLAWAGITDLHRSYDWDPATAIPGVAESSVLGVEGPLWAETLITRQDYEYMAFPRLAALAEVAWTAPNGRSWDDFRQRIGAHGARLAALGVNFARVPGVDWSW